MKRIIFILLTFISINAFSQNTKQLPYFSNILPKGSVGASDTCITFDNVTKKYVKINCSLFASAASLALKYDASNPSGFFQKNSTPLGYIIQEDFLSISDWTNVGTGTFSISGGVLTCSGGNGTTSNYLRYNNRGRCNLENIIIEYDQVVGTIGATSQGVGVGWIRNSTYLPTTSSVTIHPIVSSSNTGKIKMFTLYNSGVLKDSSANGLTITAGDTLHVKVIFDKDRYITRSYNKKTKREISYVHIVSQSVPVREVSPAAYDFTINVLGSGTQKILNFTVFSEDVKNSNMGILGHSISKGTGLDNLNERWPSLITNNTTKTITLNAGGSNRIDDVNLTEFLSLNPDTVLIDLGLNDINDGKTIGQFGIAYRAMIATITAYNSGKYIIGRNLFACNITPCSTITNFANIPNYNLVIDTIMGASGTIDLYSEFISGGSTILFPDKSSDKVHPNKAGHTDIFRLIAARLNLKLNQYATKIPLEGYEFQDAINSQAHGSYDGSKRGWYIQSIDANTTLWMQGMSYNSQTATYTAWTTTPTMIAQGGGAVVLYTMSGATVGGTVSPVEKFRINSNGQIVIYSTVTPAGTTGNQTINRPCGTVNIAAGGTSVIVTNSLITTSSIINWDIRSNDATALKKNYVPVNGGVTFTLNTATTAETSIGWCVVN